MNITDLPPAPFVPAGKLPEELYKAVSRLKAHKAAAALSKGRRNPVKDPAACWTSVDNGASGEGRRYRSWQCKNPVRPGEVDGHRYCVEHFDDAQHAYLMRLDDRAYVRFHGIDPDNLPTLPPRGS